MLRVIECPVASRSALPPFSLAKLVSVYDTHAASLTHSLSMPRTISLFSPRASEPGVRNRLGLI